MNKLTSKIPLDSMVLTKEYYNDWINVQDLLPDMISNIAEIPPAKVQKYRFDMEGLFKEFFNMDTKYIFPHILVNGYLSSSDFNCERLRFNMLNTSMLDEYELFFRRKK